MMEFYGRLMDRIAAAPTKFAAIFALFAALCFFGASRVHLDGDLARLLPESSSTVQGLRHLEANYGDQIGRLTVVLASTDVAQTRVAAQALVPPLSELPGVDRVEIKDPRESLRPLRLLYMDISDLREVDERLSKRIRWEKQRANPLFVDVGGKPRPQVDTTDIEAKYSGQLGQDTFFEGPNGEVLVFVRPNFPAADLDEVRQLVANVQNTLDRELHGTGITAAMTGRYVKRIDQQDILTSDIARATPVAFVLLAIFLLAYFRSVASTVLVVVPLVVGTAAGLSFAVLVFGNLNILTGFLGAILMGLGVDYGIHLISRYLEVRRTTDLAPPQAWVEGFRTAGRASIFAGLTTMVALGSLAVSTFRAFTEFGIIAMGGITLILLSYALLLPTLVFLTPERWLRPSMASAIGSTLERRLAGFGASERPKHLKAMMVGGALTVIGLGIGGLVGAPSASFDRTFASLAMTSGPTWKLDEMVNGILGESQTPAVVMVESQSHAQAVVEELARRQAEPGGEAIGRVVSLQDVVPDDQPAKFQVLRDLKNRIDAIPAERRSEQLVDFLSEIDGVLAHGVVNLDTLPRSVSRPFARLDRPEASIVLVLPGVDLNTAEGSQAFTQRLRALPGADGGTVDAIADSMLLVDILAFVVHDTEWMVGLTLAGLVFIAVVAFGPRRDAVLLLGFLGVSMVAAVGVVALSGHTFNFINVLVFPIWLGLGVDASFHLLIGLREHPGRFGDVVATTVSVGAAFLTSVIGFASLTLSHHAGLNSLGWVASVGLLVVLVVSAALAGVMGAHSALKEET